MATATSILPFQPAPGLPARDALARAHDYIDKITRKHEAASKGLEAIVTVAKRHGNTFIQSSCTATTAAALGITMGRFGGETGVVEKWGVPLDAAVAVAGHVSAFAFSYADDRQAPRFDLLTEVLHTVGDTGLASGIYRFFHKVGSQHAAAAGAEAAPSVAPNGVKGGTVYTVAHPGK
jgi:hypothetical protein